VKIPAHKSKPRTVHQRKNTAKKLIQNYSDNPNHSHSRITQSAILKYDDKNNNLKTLEVAHNATLVLWYILPEKYT